MNEHLRKRKRVTGRRAQVKLRLAGITRESVVDGPGIRVVVFAQGCPHHCNGCQNPETHDPVGGKVLAIEEIVEMVRPTPITRGITFSGGEPFMQAKGFGALGRCLKSMGLDIVTYTGYTWEALTASDNRAWRELLEVTDLLIDGPFVESQKDTTIAFRGSRNQRIIDVAESLKLGRPVDLSGRFDQPKTDQGVQEASSPCASSRALFSNRSRVCPHATTRPPSKMRQR